MTPAELDDLVGRNVRAARSRQRMRQDDLADELGWTRPMVTKLEAGRRRITLIDAMAICGALEIDLRQLIAGVDAEDLKKLGIDRRG